MIDWEQNPTYLEVAEAILGVKFDRRAATWLTSKSQDGRVLGVVVFSRFTEGNCEISVAGLTPTFISKSFAFAVALYVFDHRQLNCRRVTAVIAVTNEKSLSLAQQLGFKREGTLQRWYPPKQENPTGDAFILGLLREDCKWLKDIHGQPEPPDSA